MTASDPTYNAKTYDKQGGASRVFESGSDLTLLSGSTLDVQTGVTLSGQFAKLTTGAAAYKIARGVQTSVAAVDTVVTGLTTVVAAVASLEDDPSTATLFVQAVVGDQAGTPAAGSILIKSWKPTAVNDVTPTAATSFGKKISWIAVGT